MPKNQEYVSPYHHLTQTTICKTPMQLFFFELLETIKINGLHTALENEYSPILFVNAELPECIDFMKLYRSSASLLNVHVMSIHGITSVNSYNQMDFIFINFITRQEYYAALNIVSMYQKIKGTLIIKTSKLFYKQSIELMVALNAMYSQVFIIQPSILDPLSGELFIVCKGRQEKKLTNFHASTISCPCSTLFLNKVEDINIYFGKKQLESLQKYMDNVSSTMLNDTSCSSHHLINTNMTKCIQWCNIFNVPNHMSG